MAPLRLNKQKQFGFTLVEVLIALAILAISLSAIIHAVNTNIANTKRIQDLSFAEWVLDDAVGLMTLGIIKASGNEIHQQTIMGNNTWIWQANVNPSEFPALQDVRLSIQLGRNDNISLETVIPLPKKST